jgi:phosphatidate cytidylyltransferase
VRFATGLVLVPITVLFVILGGGFLFVILELVIVGCALEFWRIVDTRREQFSLLLGMGGALLVGVGFYVDRPLLFIVIPILVILSLRLLRRPRDGPESVATTLMGVLYPAIFLSHIIPLRKMGLEYALTPLVYTWAFDVSAYLIGRKFGRRRIAPGISPGKSLEGTLGGLVVTVLVSLIARLTFAQFLSLSHAMALAVMLSLTGQLGDLFESFLKRSAEVKDSSAVLPGHGGLLDRLDSLIFTIPVAYYYLTWLVW